MIYSRLVKYKVKMVSIEWNRFYLKVDCSKIRKPEYFYCMVAIKTYKNIKTVLMK